MPVTQTIHSIWSHLDLRPFKNKDHHHSKTDTLIDDQEVAYSINKWYQEDQSASCIARMCPSSTWEMLHLTWGKPVTVWSGRYLSRTLFVQKPQPTSSEECHKNPFFEPFFWTLFFEPFFSNPFFRTLFLSRKQLSSILNLRHTQHTALQLDLLSRNKSRREDFFLDIQSCSCYISSPNQKVEWTNVNPKKNIPMHDIHFYGVAHNLPPHTIIIACSTIVMESLRRCNVPTPRPNVERKSTLDRMKEDGYGYRCWGKWHVRACCDNVLFYDDSSTESFIHLLSSLGICDGKIQVIVLFPIKQRCTFEYLRASRGSWETVVDQMFQIQNECSRSRAHLSKWFWRLRCSLDISNAIPAKHK